MKAENKTMRVLVVEDNHYLSNSLKNSLTKEGYNVDVAYDGEDGEHLALLTAYDAIILDVMLPGQDGLTLCKNLRHKHIKTPVIMLTARDTIDDRVAGLDSGADDYLVKPFAMRELLARLRSVVRRLTDNQVSSNLLQVSDLTLDLNTKFAYRNERVIELTTKEYDLLEFFMRHPNQLLSREALETYIWSYELEVTSNVIDVYIRRLRRKIDDPSPVKLFETVRGSGYRLRSSSSGSGVAS